VNAGLAVLLPPDVQACRAAKLDLRPFQIADFRRPQTVPEGNQDQGRIAVSVATATACLAEPTDLLHRQILAWT